jgi:acetyl-CoA synthetase/medium-chain acyl-CoA synthetase
MATSLSIDPGLLAYHEQRRAFQWDVPEYYNFAVDTIGVWAADPTRLAMLHLAADGQERRITFAQFAQRSDRLASALRQRGIGPGDRVLVVLPRIPEWNEAILALMKLGAIAVPGTPLLMAGDLQARLQRSGAKGIITSGEIAERVDQIADACPSLDLPIVVGQSRAGWVAYEAALAGAPVVFQPVRTRSDDPCLLYFTSGTTGQPKMILQSHAFPIGMAVTGGVWRTLPAGDLVWVLSDTGWAAAMISFFGGWSVGTPLFVHDARGRFNPRHTLDLLADHPIGSFFAPPTIYRMLILEDLTAWTPRALRLCLSGGEPLNAEVEQTWQTATGLPIHEIYGQTEIGLVVSSVPPLAVRPGSIGKAIPGYDVAVVDDAGHELGLHEEGNLAVRIRPQRPPGIFLGYWDDPVLTEQAFAGEWYVTGDRASRDADGYLWFAGRADDIIKSSGYRIGPFEVESVLQEHPAVAESAVVGRPDPLRGQVVKAFVVLTPGYTASAALAEELQAFVRQQTAPYKYPREIAFVGELPKTISGKIRRVELRDREFARRPSSNCPYSDT